MASHDGWPWPRLDEASDDELRSFRGLHRRWCCHGASAGCVGIAGRAPCDGASAGCVGGASGCVARCHCYVSCAKQVNGHCATLDQVRSLENERLSEEQFSKIKLCDEAMVQLARLRKSHLELHRENDHFSQVLKANCGKADQA